LREQIRAESEIRKRIEDLEVFKVAALDISSGRDMTSLYATIVKSAVRLLSCDAGGIAIFDDSEHVIRFPFVHNLPESITHKSIRHNSDIFSETISTERSSIVSPGKEAPYPLNVLHDEGIRSLALVPLIARGLRGQTLGVLWAASRKTDKTFTDYDMVLLESLGAQASVSIDNINLFVEQQHISDVLQRGFLPDKTPVMSQTDFGIFYASATEAAVVGGDFYDFIPLSKETMALALGDSSGKGVEATADAAMVKYSLHSALFGDPDPAKTLTKSNAVAYAQLKNGHFVTLVYGVYDARSGKLDLGIAGHPYPIHYSSRLQSVEFVEGEDPAFGLVRDNVYESRGIMLEPDDVMVFYTDGIIELRRDKDLYGAGRLADVVLKNARKGAQEIANSIIDATREFAAGKFTDDIVVLVIKRVAGTT